MPPKIPPNTNPRPARPSWRDHEDWIDDLKDGPKPKPPSDRRTTIMVLDEPVRDGAPVPPELDDAAPRTAHSAGEE